MMGVEKLRGERNEVRTKGGRNGMEDQSEVKNASRKLGMRSRAL
jgi:hypothetical protein